MVGSWLAASQEILLWETCPGCWFLGKLARQARVKRGQNDAPKWHTAMRCQNSTHVNCCYYEVLVPEKDLQKRHTLGPAFMSMSGRTCKLRLLWLRIVSKHKNPSLVLHFHLHSECATIPNIYRESSASENDTAVRESTAIRQVPYLIKKLCPSELLNAETLFNDSQVWIISTNDTLTPSSSVRGILSHKASSLQVPFAR